MSNKVMFLCYISKYIILVTIFLRLEKAYKYNFLLNELFFN
jgi:hypothetical protein